jgi:hypothetical protein
MVVEMGRSMNILQIMYTHAYKCQMIPVGTVSGVRGWEMKDSSGGMNSSMIYLIDCKNLCKYYSVPPPSEQESRGLLSPWVD